MLIEQLNAAEMSDARTAFLGCCGSSAWVEGMIRSLPFESVEHFHQVADQVFAQLDEQDWLEAFAAHPKLGDLSSLRMKFAGNKQWSTGEQAGVQEADAETLEALAKGNARYEQKFGYIFILCATGVSAKQMLTSLNNRLDHLPDQELLVASEQQRQITHLRIDKLLDSQDNSD